MQKTLPKKEKDRRAKVMVVIIAIAFLACVGNLFRIQVVQADYYKGKAEENQLYDTEIPAQRGTIYDSEGNVLAQSASVWLVYIDPYSVPDDSVRADLCRDLSNALGINGDTLMKKLKMTKYRYLVIAKQVEYDNKEKVVEIKKKKYVYGKKGEEQYAYGSAMVGIDPDVKRYYPNPPAISSATQTPRATVRRASSYIITASSRVSPAERSPQRMPTAGQCRFSMRLFMMRRTGRSSS